MPTFSAKLSTHKSTMSQLLGQQKAHQKQYATTCEQLATLRTNMECTEKALVIAQDVAQQTQQELEFRISDIVTSSLAAVFDDPYEFKVRFDIKRSKTEAVLLFTRDGMEIDPLTASGGGVVEVAALALRIACFLISSPKPAPVLVLDEPAKCVSAGFREKYADLLETLSSKLGIQIIMITHIDEYAIGNVITLV